MTAGSTAPGDPLADLVGRPRAQLLRSLTSPTATAFLAEARGVTPSAVSHHLVALHATGLVDKHRRGRYVVYGLTPLGHALLHSSENDPLRTVIGPGRAGPTRPGATPPARAVSPPSSAG